MQHHHLSILENTHMADALFCQEYRMASRTRDLNFINTLRQASSTTVPKASQSTFPRCPDISVRHLSSAVSHILSPLNTDSSLALLSDLIQITQHHPPHSPWEASVLFRYCSGILFFMLPLVQAT